MDPQMPNTVLIAVHEEIKRDSPASQGAHALMEEKQDGQ